MYVEVGWSFRDGPEVISGRMTGGRRSSDPRRRPTTNTQIQYNNLYIIISHIMIILTWRMWAPYGQTGRL